MKYEPKPHQKFCIDRLTGPSAPASAGLLLDMGLGKTSIALTAADLLLWDEFALDAFLVIAPLRVAQDTWSTEHGKWDHLGRLRVSSVLGTEKRRMAALEKWSDLYVINRENVEWLCSPGIWPFDGRKIGIIIDELSSFKNQQAKRWRALKRRVPPDAPVWGLTGTIAPRGYIDLWPQIYLLDRGQRLETAIGRYRDKYFDPGARKGHIVYEWRLKQGAKEAIDTRLSDLCLSMRKEDWVSLPPITYNRVPVRMSTAERKVYDTLKKERVLTALEGKELDSAIVGATAAALSNKLLQMAGGAVYDEDGGVTTIHSRKLDALDELAEAAQGQPLLVFYNYQHEADRILAKFPAAVKMGDEKDTAALIARWNRGEVPMLICHPASAGHGLNLQGGGHIVVWYGLPWSLELYQQANARLHRMGQTDPVVVQHIVCEGTLDDKVLSVLSGRAEVQDSLLNALKAYIQTSA